MTVSPAPRSALALSTILLLYAMRTPFRTSTVQLFVRSPECYRDEGFPSSSLTMLGAKTTIKERWRQVLEEANRIERKHLITLEPAVSVDYTNAMRDSKLQLVIPSQLFPTYTPSQQEWLMDVGGFCEMVEERQRVLD